jgi:histidinol phosphatase-like PHP family hydrolase
LVAPVKAESAALSLAEIAYRHRLREDLYRARAFGQAALSLVRMQPDLVETYRRDALQTLPGVGPGIAKVLADLVEHGRSQYLERMREEGGESPDLRPPLALDGYQGDLHSHTTWSDGRASVVEMARAARSRGLCYLAVTDHSPRLAMIRGLGPDRLVAQRAEIEEAAQEVEGMTILQGIEVDINEDGSLDLPDETLAGLAPVVASPHVKLTMAPAAMTERMLRAVEHPSVHVIGHPTGRRPGARAGAQYDFEAVFKKAAERGVALEMSCDPARMDLSPELARLAGSLGCGFALDSDAHAPVELANVPLGLWAPSLAGLGQERFLNWLPLPDLLARLGR